MAKKQVLDEGYQETEDILEELEKRIQREYKKACNDIEAKVKAYWKQYESDLKKQEALLEAGKITEKDLNDWKIRHLGMGKRWEDMRETIAEDLQNTDQIARKMVGESLKDVYAVNHNFATYKIMHDGNLTYSYTLYDHKTVERILRDNPKLYHDPGKELAKKIASGEVKAWNEKQVQSSVIQSILQGDSIPEAAERLAVSVSESVMNSTLRNTRTMITGAQNAGRMDSYHDAQDMGIRLKKKWIATLDNRTRHTHRELHGVTIDVDDPFETEDGDIMYPGDPSADGSLVYNCRCSLESVIEGFERDTVTSSPKMGDMTYEEWKEGGT